MALLARIAAENAPLVPNGRGGYEMAGNAVNRQAAFALLARGLIAWENGAHHLTAKGREKLATVSA